MDSAKLSPEACRSWGAQAALLSVAHQALVENVGVEAPRQLWVCSCWDLLNPPF